MNIDYKKEVLIIMIEDYWEDKTAYYITFLTTYNKKINLLVFLPMDIDKKKEIPNIIKTKFNNVAEILMIDEFGEGLLLK